MGKLDLQIQANLENVTDLGMSIDEDWYFLTKC
jgi:hypothetical protein